MSCKVGIILLTKNRANFVIRQLEYYKLSNNQHPLYIGDSSDIIQKNILTKKIDYYKKFFKINYYHVPQIDVIETHMYISNKIIEKYCVYIGDDDFFVPNSLTKCANFLEENNNYSSAHGNAAIFKLDGEETGNLSYIGNYWSNIEYINDKSSNRVFALANHYKVLQFAVQRTNQYLNIANNYKKMNNHAFTELLHGFCSVAYGKAKHLDCFYLIRQTHNKRTKLLGISEWIKKEGWSDSYNLFIELISNIVINKQDIDRITAKEKNIDAFEYYLNSNIQSQFKHKNKNKNIAYKRFIPRVLIIILKKIRNIYVRIFLYSNDNYLYKIDNKKSKYYLSLKHFYEVISVNRNKKVNNEFE